MQIKSIKKIHKNGHWEKCPVRWLEWNEITELAKCFVQNKN